MTFIDWFAGVGGFRRGMELAGNKCVGFCEFDKFAAASYTSMHLITDEQRERLAKMPLKQRQKEILKDEYRNGEWYAPDIRYVRADDVPDAECWCFGAPCQDFSVAGKRAGLDGDRSSLVREIFRLCREKGENKPEWLIYENVKGMLSSNRGFDFLAILLEMGELGYDIEWQLFNTKNFGIPQNRERVYVVGHLRTAGRKQVFPLVGADEEDSFIGVKQIGKCISERNNKNQYRVYDKDGLGACLNCMGGGGLEPHTAIPMFGIDYNKGGQERQIANTVTCRNIVNGLTNIKQDGTAVCVPINQENDGTSRTIKAQYSKNSGANFIRSDALGATGAMLKIKTATKQGYDIASPGDSINLSMPESKTRRGRVGKDIANTLDTSCEQGVPVIWYDKYKCYIAIRKLTPRECFRLQGWEDKYFERAQFVNSDSQLYKQAGNGVTVAVIAHIIKEMMRANNDEV